MKIIILFLIILLFANIFALDNVIFQNKEAEEETSEIENIDIEPEVSDDYFEGYCDIEQNIDTGNLSMKSFLISYITSTIITIPSCMGCFLASPIPPIIGSSLVAILFNMQETKMPASIMEKSNSYKMGYITREKEIRKSIVLQKVFLGALLGYVTGALIVYYLVFMD